MCFVGIEGGHVHCAYALMVPQVLLPGLPGREHHRASKVVVPFLNSYQNVKMLNFESMALEMSAAVYEHAMDNQGNNAARAKRRYWMMRMKNAQQ